MLEVSIEPEASAVHNGLRGVPVLIITLLSVVLKIASPVAGNMTAFCWVVVIRGSKNPLVVLLTSSIALVSGKLPVALIETFCANKFGAITKDINRSNAVTRVFMSNLFWISFQDVKSNYCSVFLLLIPQLNQRQ